MNANTAKTMNLEEGAQHKKAPIVGIDLGTTNCAVTVYNSGKTPTLLPIGGPGKYTMQSCILWTGGESFIVGQEAYDKRYLSNGIYSAKRDIGTDRVYSLRFTDNNGAEHTKEMRPHEVAAVILKELKQRTEELYGHVDSCVITVPAYFNQLQIGDTIKAGELAGWNVKQILKEPTSASYVYSQLGYAQDGNVLVYDLGGGTFDATFMTFLRTSQVPKKLFDNLRDLYGIEYDFSNTDNSDQYFCRVISTFGDTHLGGDDIDRNLANILVKRYHKKVSYEDFEQLVLQCEEFKKAEVEAMDVRAGKHVMRVTQPDLIKAVDVVFRETMKLMQNFDKSHVNTIVLVGGSTKNKYIRQKLSEEFPGAEISLVLDPDSTVAMGAGSVAKAIDSDAALMYQDVLPMGIGVLVDDCRVEFPIKANTSMPYSVKCHYRTISPTQEKLEVKLYQGMSQMPEKCTFLGTVTVDNLPQGGDKCLGIDISLVLSAQGRLHVISKVEGAEERELVIENILDVEQNTGEVEKHDDFKDAFYDVLKDSPEAVILFEKRDDATSAEEREEIENALFDLI